MTPREGTLRLAGRRLRRVPPAGAGSRPTDDIQRRGHVKIRFLPAALFLVIAARPVAAASPNLLTNGSFDSSLGGWSNAPNATWSFALGGTALIFTSPTPGSEV